jgi:hypothetical protein
MAIPQLITNPKTGETKSIRQWAISLGINPVAFANRLKKYKEPEAIFSKPESRQWTTAEDELLKSLFPLPNAIARYSKQSQRYGLGKRTCDAIQARIVTLQQKGDIPNGRSELEIALKSGCVSPSQLASCLNVSESTVEDFFLKMLKYENAPTGRIVELRRFAKWATTPVGSALIASSIKQDEIAIAWLVQTIGKWLWVG